MSENLKPHISPQPETDQFKKEMLNPSYFEEGGVRYGVFQLNTHMVADGGIPVLINLAHGEEASVGAGRYDLNAFAQTLGRPLVAIDMAGMGESKWQRSGQLSNATFDSLAQNHLRILDSLGVEDFDIVGNSMGGVMGARIATLAGDRAKHLVTFSAPGFEARSVGAMVLKNRKQNTRDFKRTKETLPHEVQVEVNSAVAHRKQNPSAKKIQMIRSILRYGRLLTEPVLGDIETQLSQTTQWFDVIGTNDAFSDWTQHTKAVDARNVHYPESSDIKLLKGETHAWQAYYRWEVAAIAAQALEK